MLNKLAFTTLLIYFTFGFLQSQTAVKYEISFENAVHHEAEIKIQFSNVANGKFSFRMSRTSPGRYAIHEFAKNVYNVTHVIFFNIGDGNVGKFFLHFDTENFQIRLSICQYKGNNAATCSQVKHLISRTEFGITGQQNRIDGKAVAGAILFNLDSTI